MIYKGCFIKKDEYGEKSRVEECFVVEDGEFALEQLFEEAGLPFPPWNLEKKKALNEGSLVLFKEEFIGVGPNDDQIAKMDFDEFIIEKGKY
ncbi:hypothetical protein SAMN02745945_00190 [Peptoclostridium litorale DSM 5388]|uniref:Uncharacterized protein n=1 Tax=Peptoclostridium litorale DSM 5388 TaxID=1121324 RepID=A0A069RIF2_PEPLI|nr:hypothetical protein [Peptoclostridium litorale]KDR96563.1 hypothetical protein CLIT_2c01690 [Peptoclostridium litorale DSM 5388]SIN69085.1 hypothetical protein SAMN02745945_00190 [Peptoclostridium litorale DSM 5388]